MYYLRRSLFECTGGKLVSRPPNPLISNHNSNASNIRNPKHDIGKQLRANVNTQITNIHQSYVYLYCDIQGKLAIPSDSLHEMPNVLVRATRKSTEPEAKTTFMIFGVIGLGDFAIEEMIRTERNLNSQNITELYDFVTEKLRQIKNDPTRGLWEAIKWSKFYESILEVKNVAGWWNIYYL